MANGIYSNVELIDSLIVDCNTAVKNCVGGQYVAFCNVIVQMVQKLANLKRSVVNDLKNREETIKSLEYQLAELGCPVEKIAPEELLKEGDVDGKRADI